MDMLANLAAQSPYLDKLLHLVGDVTGVALCLALAYLAYGLAHNVADLLAKKEHRVWQWTRKVCHFAIDVLLYVISALYAVEYILMKAADAS